jgi:hypothetical protein
MRFTLASGATDKLVDVPLVKEVVVVVAVVVVVVVAIVVVVVVAVVVVVGVVVAVVVAVVAAVVEGFGLAGSEKPIGVKKEMEGASLNLGCPLETHTKGELSIIIKLHTQM